MWSIEPIILLIHSLAVRDIVQIADVKYFERCAICANRPHLPQSNIGYANIGIENCTSNYQIVYTNLLKWSSAIMNSMVPLFQ